MLVRTWPGGCGAGGGGISKLLERVQRSRFPHEPTSRGAAVSDALPDPVARGRVVDRLDLAALQVGNDQLQALPGTWRSAACKMISEFPKLSQARLGPGPVPSLP